MRRTIYFFFLLPQLCLAANGLDEFNLERFTNSSFNCSTWSDCNNGTCVSGKCECTLGYRDSVTQACEQKMPVLDKGTPFWLETFLGILFPAGLAYLKITPAVIARLFPEAMAIGLGIGGYREKPDSFERAAYWMGSGIFTIIHLGAWGATVYGLKQFWKPDQLSISAWHKDKGMADLVVPANKLVDSVRIIRKTFADTDCAIVEQCVDGTGERRLLIFDSYLYNQGDSDFVVGLEQIDPVWSTCHQHFHGPDSTSYLLEHQLNSANGTTVKTLRYGHKQGFCFLDSTKFSGSYDAKFSCGLPPLTRQYTQGITSGHSDLYPATLDCQWIDITDVAAGDYELKITVNPKGLYYQDEDLTNNESVIKVRILEADKKEKSAYGVKVDAWVVKGPEV